MAWGPGAGRRWPVGLVVGAEQGAGEPSRPGALGLVSREWQQHGTGPRAGRGLQRTVPVHPGPEFGVWWVLPGPAGGRAPGRLPGWAPPYLARMCGLPPGERPFPCTLCEKAFNQKSALQVHVKKHTGERPYRCEHCAMGFTQKSNMKLHVKRAHSYAGERAAGGRPQLSAPCFPEWRTLGRPVSGGGGRQQQAAAGGRSCAAGPSGRRLSTEPCVPFGPGASWRRAPRSLRWLGDVAHEWSGRPSGQGQCPGVLGTTGTGRGVTGLSEEERGCRNTSAPARPAAPSAGSRRVAQWCCQPPSRVGVTAAAGVRT